MPLAGPSAWRDQTDSPGSGSQHRLPGNPAGHRFGRLRFSITPVKVLKSRCFVCWARRRRTSAMSCSTSGTFRTRTRCPSLSKRRWIGWTDLAPVRTKWSPRGHRDHQGDTRTTRRTRFRARPKLLKRGDERGKALHSDRFHRAAASSSWRSSAATGAAQVCIEALARILRVPMPYALSSRV